MARNTTEEPRADQSANIAPQPDGRDDSHPVSRRAAPPEILAPAGDMDCALAALAAGADAIYVGLKHFSARMQAENFSVKDLARLSGLCHEHGRKLYVTLNALFKPADLDAAGRLIKRLARHVQPDALIVQDLAAPLLARQAGFQGEIHLSTLANVSHQAGLEVAAQVGANRVVVPRELSIDEIRAMDQARPEGVDLEVFVHGALCFCVSGRCYWSSYMGGKSGLRGRCVQPCRRVYTQGKSRARYFSCMDLGLDVLVKSLLSVEGVGAWKIEGRKKGPHYVYYATTAYRLLRDNPSDARAKKQAASLLDQALGRERSHYGFLPQKPHNPTLGPGGDHRTGSGLLVGKVQGGGPVQGGGYEGTYFIPRTELLPGDLVRVGVEDAPGHRVVRINRRVPKGGRFEITPAAQKGGPGAKGKPFGKGPKGKGGKYAAKNARGPMAKGPGGRPGGGVLRGPKPGTPVTLLDRREPEMKKLLNEWRTRLDAVRVQEPGGVRFTPHLPEPFPRSGEQGRIATMFVSRRPPKGKHGRGGKFTGVWFTPQLVRELSRTVMPNVWWWLPPVVWPTEEEALRRALGQALRDKARNFVLGAPWQAGLFASGDANPPEDLHLVAGPFCNPSNALALEAMAQLGCEAAIVSPELAKDDFLALPRTSPIPLGVVIKGNWPVGITRVQATGVKIGEPLASPQGEQFWVKRYGGCDWVYPNWPLDLVEHKRELEQAGYTLFVTMEESLPRRAKEAERTSSFNWDLTLY